MLEPKDNSKLSRNREILAEGDLQPLEIRNAELTDLAQVRTLMVGIFGSHSEIDRHITKWIQDSSFSLKVALSSSQVIGCSTVCEKLDTDLSRYLSFGEFAVNQITGKKLAFVLNLAVLPEFRLRGLGKKLALAHLKWIGERNCDLVVGSSWVNGTDATSLHLFQGFGFQKIGESREYLRNQLKDRGTCAACMRSDCDCISILFAAKTSELLRFI